MVQLIEDTEPNRVSDFFKDKTIFITGASGFVGKVLIEKLLRSCTKLKKIYVLMREKKGKSVQERIQEMFSGPLYEMVKKQHGKIVFEKVEVISGDIEAPDLGISLEDRKKLIEEVEIIYHSAATVQFDEPFKKTVLMNVRGTKLMIELAKNCKNLIAFCHLSTAYCQENQEILLEKTYPPPADPHRVIEICEWMDETTLELIAKNIRGWSANNYTFTKALGEGLVTEQMDHLPIFIQRPSAVIPIWKEPLPGWTDNINGPTGLLLGAGKGVIRTMYGRPNYFVDYVPVDCVASALICCVYDYVTYGTRRVYNVTSSDEVRITFQQTVEIGEHIINNAVAFDTVLWYPGGSITTNRTLHILKFILFQLIPAILVDCLLFLLGFKPFLTRVQRKIWRGYKIFEYYANRKWLFKKDNCSIGRNLLNNKEKDVFVVQAKELDIYKYFVDCTIGARRYLMKEKDENIPKALRRLKILWFLDQTMKFAFLLGLMYYLFNKLMTRLNPTV